MSSNFNPGLSQERLNALKQRNLRGGEGKRDKDGYERRIDKRAHCWLFGCEPTSGR